MSTLNTTLDDIVESLAISQNETQIIATQWFDNVDPSRPKHNEQMNAGYMFLIAIAIIIGFGCICVLLPQNMVKQSGTIHDLDGDDTNKNHYVIKHDIDNNDDNKLKDDKETIIFKKPTFIHQPFEHSLSSTETDDGSVYGSDIEFEAGTESETSIESSLLPLSINRLNTIMEEQEEQ